VSAVQVLRPLACLVLGYGRAGSRLLRPLPPLPQGVVYYGRYLPYFDHARTEYHRHLGEMRVDGAEFVMRASEVEYLAPARFDDLIESFVRVRRIGNSSVTYECAAYRLPDDRLMVRATQTVVLVDLVSRRPRRVPEELRRPIREFEGAELEE